MGADPEKVVSRDSLANPEALDWFVGLADRERPLIAIPRGSSARGSPRRKISRQSPAAYAM